MADKAPESSADLTSQRTSSRYENMVTPKSCVYSLQHKLQAYGSKHPEIRMDPVFWINRSGDGDAGSLPWQMLVSGDRLHELNTTGCYDTEKKLGQRESFNRTTALGGPVYHEMVVSGAT